MKENNISVNTGFSFTVLDMAPMLVAIPPMNPAYRKYLNPVASFLNVHLELIKKLTVTATKKAETLQII